MHLALTLVCFVLLSIGLLILRLQWRRLAARIRLLLVLCATISVLLFVLSLATHWSFTWDRANAALYWSAIASYEMLLLLLTQLRPRPLTAVVAVLLFLPVFSASIFLPLSELFDRVASQETTLSPEVFCIKRPFASNSPAYSGVDLTVYSHPNWLPLLRHRRRTARYLDTQCNTGRSTAQLQPNRDLVHMVCPPWPGEGRGGTDITLPLE